MMKDFYVARVTFFITACPLPPIKDTIMIPIPVKYTHCEVDEQNYIGSVIHGIADDYIEEAVKTEKERYDAHLNRTISFQKI